MNLVAMDSRENACPAARYNYAHWEWGWLVLRRVKSC